ncbi:MAG: TetR/AcrR family transcriptional regulator [Bacteroidales bacterium]
MKSAMELFALEGYYNTSISQIARKAGISKGLMYNYFGSKEVLLRSIVLEGIQEMLESFDLNRDGELTREELLYFVDQLFSLLKNKTLYWKLYFSIVVQSQVSKIIINDFREIIPPFLQTMKKYFAARGAEKPESEALFFISVMDGLALNYIMNPDHFPLDEIREIIHKRFVK